MIQPATKADNFLNTCVTIVAVLIVVTLIVMGFILLKCFSIQEVCNRTITAYGDMNTSLSCESDECKAYALTMRASKLDFQEACEDFYEHVCGGWTRTAKVAPDEVFKSVARDMRRAVEDQISEILNNTVISYRDQTAAQKAAALYQGCINIELRLDALVSVTAHLDYHNSERYILYIGQPSFGVETLVLRGRYRTPFFRILHRYKLYIYRCALLLGANVAAADIVNDIVNFEAKLAYISEPPTEVRNPQSVYNLMSLKMLEGAIPEIRWVYFLNIVLRDVGVSLDLDDHVVVMHPLYLKRLSRLLKEVSTVANYIGWRIVQTMGIHTMDRFRRSRFRFDRYRYLVQDIIELPRECVRLTTHLMYFAVGRLYFDRHISKPAERYRKVYDLAEEVRDAFAVLIDLNTWMDTETKDRARQKLHNLQLNIGYPPWIRSDRDLDEYYKDGVNAHATPPCVDSQLPDLRKEEFFVSLLKTLQIHSRISFAKLRNVRRAPDFGPINFGALGSIIGQEITHGFGEHGAMYDDRGKLVEWWTRQTHRKFITGSRCLLEQYDLFSNPVTGKKLSINGTLEINIADNAGLRQAFKAYRVYMIKYEELYGMYAIPGTEPYTMDQIFFIAYALSRCEVARKRSMYSYLNPRETTPSRYRTIVPLMNFERFSEAFGCRVGTIMNPEQKCIVW
ncbi:hypothetical protein HPB52_010633 [Rhipicephalus sanguineus]|uniref:Neprilysin n=1 Tax=Rhipicephalus sanguineus TaxID=34632 RepID=A0A9D4PVG6_RHISA|nr:hypothetical protein HPB52_010633 [Rhipicephalus sanguineus]